jgi:hypothetical protein
METSYHQIINAFVDAHGLSRGQVIAEIERTFSSMLSRWHRKNVMVVFADGQLSAIAYHQSGAGTTIQSPIDLTTMRGWNTIKQILHKNLSTAACMDEVNRLKRKEQCVVWGEIKKRQENCLDVELEIEFGVTLLARCPLQLLGPHERFRLLKGDKKAFHLRRVEAVKIGDIPRTQLTVDRVSKSLVEQLIKEKLRYKHRETKLSCTKRYVGKKSFIESTVFLPKNVILATSEELGEHIQVNVIRKTKKQY